MAHSAWEQDAHQRKSLSIFDFDGTLAHTTTRPQGWQGKDWWGHKDSLSPPIFNSHFNQEVLDAFHEAKADPGVRVALLTGRRGNIAWKVREVLRSQGLHGRRIIPESHDKALFYYNLFLKQGKDIEAGDQHAPEAHEEYFTGDFVYEEDYPRASSNKKEKKVRRSGSGTLVHKEYVVRKLVGEHVESLSIWDDRLTHSVPLLQLCKDLLKKTQLQHATFYRVFPPQVQEGVGTVQKVIVQEDTVF